MRQDSPIFKDPYLDKTYGCLRNKLRIIDPHKLDQVEATFSMFRLIELVHTPLRKKFDLAHLQATHKYIFQDV